MRPLSRKNRLTVAPSSSTRATTISPLLGVLLLSHDDEVAGKDAGVDHALAANGEDEVGVAGELVGDRHVVLDPVLGDDRRTGGDLADQRAGS